MTRALILLMAVMAFVGAAQAGQDYSHLSGSGGRSSILFYPMATRKDLLQEIGPLEQKHNQAMLVMAFMALWFLLFIVLDEDLNGGAECEETTV